MRLKNGGLLVGFSTLIWATIAVSGWFFSTDAVDADPSDDVPDSVAQAKQEFLPPRHCSDVMRQLLAGGVNEPVSQLAEELPDYELTLAPPSGGAPLFYADATAAIPTLPVGSGSPRASAGIARPNESLFSLDYLRLLGSDVKDVFTSPVRWDSKDWITFGVVAAGIGITTVFDEDIQKVVQRNRNSRVESVFDRIQPFGAQYSFGVLGAFYVGGVLLKDSNAKATALDGLSASIIASGLITSPLKNIVGRRRPNKMDGAHHFEMVSRNMSFPSGHTTQAFAVATVIADHYDSIWIKTAAYGLASGVGYARLINNAHWGSDVLAGAAIGYFVGHEVVRFNEKHRNFNLSPVVSQHFKGIGIEWEF